MNLAKVGGTFQGGDELFKAILIEYLKYNEEVFRESSLIENGLLSEEHIIKVTVVETDVLIVNVVKRKSEVPNPIILSSRLSALFFEGTAFPLSLAPGSLKDVVRKEELTLFLSKLREILFGGSSAAPAPVKDQINPLQLPNPTFQQNHPNSFFGVGKSDMDPFDSAPGIGGYPSQGFPAGGGMFVGPDHPMFIHPSSEYGRPLPTSPGTLPMGSVPPGARFDPILPFGSKPGFPTRPSASTGRRPPISGDPDNDAFMPPGHGNY